MWKPTTQKQVLETVRSVLIAELNDTRLTEKSVFMTLEPNPEVSERDDIFITISPGDGQFEQDGLEGAGQDLCIENGSVILAVYTRQQLDKLGEHERILLGENNGHKARSILDIKRRLLQIFTDRMLHDGNEDNPILVNRMQPVHATKPQAIPQLRRADLGLIFTTDFAWDLS